MRRILTRQLTDDLETVYHYTKKVINISRLLFYKFIFELYENGFIPDAGIGTCGSNCFQCNAFLGTIEDDDLRVEYVNEMKLQGVDIRKEEIYCFGCMSGTRASYCITGCPWKPCCDKHNIRRCNSCSDYICNDLGEVFKHLPKYKENLEKCKQ